MAESATSTTTFTRVREPGTRPVIMGIVNVTPDSFSDGGLYSSPDAAIDHAIELREQGADLIDIGGESTRPGARRISIEEEQDRVIPVVHSLAGLGIAVSIDTMNSQTALAAADAGAEVINDVSGGLADPEMYRIVARTGLHYVAMHWRGHSDSMQDKAQYDDVVQQVRGELEQRVAEMLIWGIDPERIILDPGVGFSKTADHNWRLLGHLPELASLGFPVLVGASRKKFLTPFAPDGSPERDRDMATAIVSSLAAQAGAWGLRVHNAAATKNALDIWTAWENGRRA